MSTIRTGIWVTWLVFWVYWLISATRAKQGARPTRSRPPGLIILILAFLLLRIFKGSTLAVHSYWLAGAGAALFLAGLALAVWARVSSVEIGECR